MRIGTLAELTGTTTRTLRYYEQEGLLASARTTAGYRDYAPAAAHRVRNIRELLALGFTIADLRELLRFLDRDLPPTFADRGGCASAMRVADERLAQIRGRLDALSRLHDRLAERLDRPQWSAPAP